MTLAEVEAQPERLSNVEPRRHDLDALRAIAMLLGIALHAALSFAPFPWPVRDSQQSPWFALFFAAIHGFRMPLFFLLSGFFTAMLWRRRGLRALLWHRFRRVFLPCVAGVVTIVPLVGLASMLAMSTAAGGAGRESAARPDVEKALGGATASENIAWEELPLDTLAGQAKLTRAASGSDHWLVYFPVFHHLWFLWYLCWLVAGFGGIAAVVDYRRRAHVQAPAIRWRRLVASPWCYLWLLPLTMLAQSRMGLGMASFGPDTSTGLLPAPHILLYYAIFFGFGALYYLADDRQGQLGRGWPLLLAVGLLLVFPLGIDFTHGGWGMRQHLADPAHFRLISVALQTVYAWLMTVGAIGLFRRWCAGESRAMRYLSDSSYWLYIAHMPLVLVAQAAVRGWPLPAAAKFLLVNAVVVALLLIVYQKLVRYTWLGTFLNGPRSRTGVMRNASEAELART